MVIRTPGGGSVELRDLFGGRDAIPMPSQEMGSYSVAGRRVTPEKAAGLTAVLRGIRVLGETAGSLPLLIYKETGTNRTEAPDAPQWGLLRKAPNDLQSPFDFKAFLVASLIGHGGALILKAKARGAVQALYPVAPRRWSHVPASKGQAFKVVDGHKTVEVTLADAIYIPGVLLDDPYVGVSPILVAANAIGTALAGEEYAGRFYANDATPGGVIQMPQGADSQQAKDTREFWEDRHRGGPNSHKTGVLFGGATYQTVGLSAQAAQIVESQRWGVEQAARSVGLPVWAVGGVDQNPRATPEQRNMDLLQHGAMPWLIRVEEGLGADRDLFPDDAVVPGFHMNALLRADMATRYGAYLQGRQAGWLSVNDIRLDEGKEPIEGGDEYQTTPVGGAPNLQPGEGGDPNAAEPPPNEPEHA